MKLTQISSLPFILLSFWLSRGHDCPWEPHPDCLHRKGNPCDTLEVKQIMTSVRNHIQVAGLPQDHSHTICIEHIESMYAITAAASPPNLVMKAMDPKQVLMKDELKAIQHHLMWSAFASLAWSLWTRHEITCNFIYKNLISFEPGMTKSPHSSWNILIGNIKRLNIHGTIFESPWSIRKDGRRG